MMNAEKEAVCMTFGKKLQWQRKKNGLSQEALAEALGVSRQAISKWEQDGALPDAANIVRIARLFCVSTDYLLLDEIEAETLSAAPAAEAPAPPRKYPTVLSIIAISFGALGHFIIYILSRMIEVPYLRKVWMNDGTVAYEGGSGITGRNYSAFVSEYKLDLLCTLFTLLILAGTAYFIWRNRTAIRNRLSKKRSE